MVLIMLLQKLKMLSLLSLILKVKQKCLYLLLTKL